MPDELGYSVFADESGIGERYLCIGALFLPTRHVAVLEQKLQEFCDARGCGTRELSWKKCSGNEIQRYVDFVGVLWATVDVRWDFRAIVLDQEKYPLKAVQYKANTEEEGFYRFYFSFLTRSLARVAHGQPPYQLHLAVTPDRYAHRSEILAKTVGGTVGRAMGRNWQVVEVVRDHPRSYRVHQMADVLLGAVSCRWNNRNPESRKWALLKAVEAQVGKRIDRDFMPGERPFNVWAFARIGDRRWAPGSSGRVG